MDNVVHDFISWLQEEGNIDMTVWKILDDYADIYIKEKNNDN